MMPNNNKMERYRGPVSDSKDFYIKLKWLVPALFEENGRLKTDEKILNDVDAKDILKPIYENNREQYELMKSVMDFIVTSKRYMSPAVKHYYVSGTRLGQRDYSIKSGLNLSTFKSQLARCKERITKDFGPHCISDLSGNGGFQKICKNYLSKEELEVYRGFLNNQKNTIHRLGQQLTIDLKDVNCDEFEVMQPADFNRLIGELYETASKPAQDALLKKCEEAHLFGYIHHVLNAAYRTRDEQEAYEKLLKFMDGIHPLEPV